MARRSAQPGDSAIPENPTCPPDAGTSKWETAARLRLRTWVTAGPEKWIIGCIDEETGNGDCPEKLPRAAALPVILSIAKAVQRGGETVIEIAESPSAIELGEIEMFREHGMLRVNFSRQRTDETPHVNRPVPERLQGHR